MKSLAAFRYAGGISVGLSEFRREIMDRNDLEIDKVDPVSYGYRDAVRFLSFNESVSSLNTVPLSIPLTMTY
jgi:hypothetical protein